MERLIDQSTKLRKKNDLDTPNLAQIISKDEISALNKVLPFQVAVMEKVQSIRSKISNEILHENYVNCIKEWMDQGNISNLNMKQVYFFQLKLIFSVIDSV
jgi:hypothetical protein